VWPWIAICLALTFSIYALLKKKLGLDSITALWFETMLSVVPVLICLFSGGFGGRWSFGSPIHLGTTLLLVGCGLVTLVPMLFFAEATTRLNLTTMGFLQFLAPSLQFLLAVYFFGDRPDPVRFASFVVVWCSIVIFLYGQRCRIRLTREALNT
jgi:chloramphenicol-sensitive protein RarD